jgi:uncharacterized protein (DUF2345 family)
MRIKLQGWLRTIALEPWSESTPGTQSETLDVVQLRRLIADEPGAAASLRGLLHELGDVAGLSFMTDEDVAEHIAGHIARGRLRVHVERYLPMASDEVELHEPRYEAPEPLGIDEDDRHWIEVELLDEAGAPVQNERCRIVLPDGSERLERTDRNGLMRVDRTVAGQCTISFPDLDARATAPLTTISRQGTQVVATKPPSTPLHWIEVELLGEDGSAIVGERCEITLPDGKVVKRKTDRSGLIRLPRLELAGDCQIRFPDIDASAIEPLTTITRQGTQGAATPRPAPIPLHWIEVELVGEDGSPIANERCEITLPDGEVVKRKTDRSGLVRLPRIETAGDCQIRFPDLDASAIEPLTAVARHGTQVGAATPRPAPAPLHWIEVELVGEDGGPIANERCEITLPDGEVLRRKTDKNGLVRVPRIETAGDCEIRFPDIDAGALESLPAPARQGAQAGTPAALVKPAQSMHWVEVELLDESGAAIANAWCEITLPDGEVVRRKTDATGRIRLTRLASAGDCRISFVELDAAAWHAA